MQNVLCWQNFTKECEIRESRCGGCYVSQTYKNKWLFKSFKQKGKEWLQNHNGGIGYGRNKRKKQDWRENGI